MYCVMDGDRLIASVRRMGNGSAHSPVHWTLLWGLSVTPPLGREVMRFADRHEAIAAARQVCPTARVEEYNRRGERVR